MSVPKVMEKRYNEVAELIKKFSDEYLSDEYLEVCLHALEKLCRKRPSPVANGNANIWAAGIVYAVGQVNFIFDKSQKIHLSSTQLTEPFGVKKKYRLEQSS